MKKRLKDGLQAARIMLAVIACRWATKKDGRGLQYLIVIARPMVGEQPPEEFQRQMKLAHDALLEQMKRDML
jgi:hypothetical protein